MSAEAGSTLKAVVIGASGAVGANLVRELLASARWGRVTVVARRDLPELKQLPGAETKLVQHVVAMERLETDAVEPARGSDAAFCTMGVGHAANVSDAELVQVDVTYAGAFARAAHAAGVPHISLLSAVSADPTSKRHYARTKAAAEQTFTDTGIARCSYFRPSMLKVPEARFGFADKMAQAIFPKISGLFPAKNHEVRVEDLGRAMRINAEHAPLSGASTTTNSAGQTIEVLFYPEYLRLFEQENNAGAGAGAGASSGSASGSSAAASSAKASSAASRSKSGSGSN